jgi:DNA-binding Lrp family transcriptional regulator
MPKLNDKPQPDDVDRQMMECIIQNPRATVQGLVQQLEARHIRMSESAIQKRLADLLTEKRLERVMIVRDWVAAGYPLRYRINIKANMRELRLGRGGPPDDTQTIDSQKKLASYIKDVLARRYQDRLVILDVRILLGYDADLSVTLRTKDTKTIFEFVTEGLRVLGGVDSTMTSHEVWTYGEAE